VAVEVGRICSHRELRGPTRWLTVNADRPERACRRSSAATARLERQIDGSQPTPQVPRVTNPPFGHREQRWISARTADLSAGVREESVVGANRLLRVIESAARIKLVGIARVQGRLVSDFQCSQGWPATVQRR
jgi:hypothetical protein